MNAPNPATPGSTLPAPTIAHRPGVLRRVARIAALCILAAWPFGVIEMVVEAARVAPPPRAPVAVWTRDQDRELRDDGGSYRFHRLWLWEPRPGAIIDGEPINEECRRGPLVPKEKGDRLRVVTLGDSSTFGMMVKDAECFSRQTETILRAKGLPVDVVNFGCIGFSTRQAVARYRDQAREWHPDVVIAALGAVNEHWPAPGGASDKEKIAMHSSMAKRVARIVSRFSTYRWLERVIHGSPASVEQSADGETTPDLQALVAGRRVPVAEFEELIVELDALVREDGAKLLLAIPPRRVDGETPHPEVLEYTAKLREVAAKRGIASVDVHSIFRAHDDADPEATKDPAKSTWFADPYHPNPEGHRVYAEALVAEIERRGWLPESGEAVPR